MPFIAIHNPDHFEVAVRKFKRICDRAGIIAAIRKQEFYEKPTWKNKRKHSAAVKRNRRAQRILF